MYGAAIGFNAPAIHSLMQGNATDLYGNKLELTFQQASWMCKMKHSYPIRCISMLIYYYSIHRATLNFMISYVFLLAGILSLGSFSGYLIFVSLMGSFGRKILVWCTTACYLIGHMAVFLASDSTTLCFSR